MRQQLFEGKWLGKIVVGSLAETLDSLREAATGGQNHDGRGVPAFAHLAQNLATITVGQAEIENMAAYRTRSNAVRASDVVAYASTSYPALVRPAVTKCERFSLSSTT